MRQLSNSPTKIDLRSDTVTLPTAEMREAMARAEVGDDVYGEDPTVNRLERRAAEILGKEAAVFVPTGTMANTIGVKLHTEHGQEVICETRSHVFNFELAMMAWFSGCVARAIAAEDGILTWEQIRREIRPMMVVGSGSTAACLRLSSPHTPTVKRLPASPMLRRRWLPG